MDATSKLLARKMFRLRVYEAKGDEFQNLFEKVMQYRHSDFTPIKPYGNSGDRKNDGYIPSAGTYFQVYAPETPEKKTTAATAANKAAVDFKGLKAYWHKLCPVRLFRFVFNDEFRGCPPSVAEALLRIKRDHKIDSGLFLAKDLEDEAMQCSRDQLMDLVNSPIPDASPLESVDFGVLREVIRHVLEKKTPIALDGILEAPDFDDKIAFNGLTKGVATLLTVGSYQSEAVADYFSNNSTFARQQLRNHLSAMYTLGRERLRKKKVSKDDLGDMVFIDLLNQIMPPGRGVSSRLRADAQAAALVVMAFYFEACDIFESPNAAP